MYVCRFQLFFAIFGETNKTLSDSVFPENVKKIAYKYICVRVGDGFALTPHTSAVPCELLDVPTHLCKY